MVSLWTDGAYSITTIDQFADSLLHDERVCEIQLPRLTQRKVLEETEGLMQRKSKLGKALGVLEGQGDDEEEEGEDGERKERYLSRSPSNSRSPSPEIEVGLKGEQEFWTEGSEDESEVEEGQAGGRFISRSPSVEASERFVSRSPSPASGDDAKMDEGP